MDGRLVFLKRILLFAILFFFIFGGVAFAQSKIDDAAGNVVRIAVKYPESLATEMRRKHNIKLDPNEIYPMGSGFMVGADASKPFQYAVTNWHVVSAAYHLEEIKSYLPRYTLTQDDLKIYIYRSADDFVPVTIYASLVDSDLVVLEIDPDHLLHGYTPLEIATGETVSRGEDVYAIGFPVIAEVRADTTTAYERDATVTKGIVSRVTTIDEVPVYQLDVLMAVGNSGGPLLNEDGQVIGINIFAFDQLTYAVQSDVLIELLESRNIPFLKVGEPLSEDAGDPESFEDNAEEEQAENTETVVTDTDDSETVLGPVDTTTDSGQYLIFGIIALGVMAVVILMLILRNKKTAALAGGSVSTEPQLTQHHATDAPADYSQSPYQSTGAPQHYDTGPAPTRPIPKETMQMPGETRQVQAPAQEPLPETRPIYQPEDISETRAQVIMPKTGIKAVSGYFAGKAIELVDGKLSIGRDPDVSQTVFPKSFDHISRKHLTITYDEKTKQFMLEDSSSNGTFLESGKKLETGVPHPLKSGEKFRLAKSEEVFELFIDS